MTDGQNEHKKWNAKVRESKKQDTISIWSLPVVEINNLTWLER